VLALGRAETVREVQGVCVCVPPCLSLSLKPPSFPHYARQNFSRARPAHQNIQNDAKCGLARTRTAVSAFRVLGDNHLHYETVDALHGGKTSLDMF
jgi:hypothetical protein